MFLVELKGLSIILLFYNFHFKFAFLELHWKEGRNWSPPATQRLTFQGK